MILEYCPAIEASLDTGVLQYARYIGADASLECNDGFRIPPDGYSSSESECVELNQTHGEWYPELGTCTGINY